MKQTKFRKLILLILMAISFASACKKPVLEFITGTFIKDIWEVRAQGLTCNDSSSSNTISNQELTFNENHILCIRINMDEEDFDKMRHESRFGPDIRLNEGATAAAAAMEYAGQCGVPFPEEYNWFKAQIKVDGIEINDVGIRKKGFLGSIYSVAPAIKINIDKYIPNNTLAQTKRITLNNNAEDPSRIIQCLSYKLFETIGYPAPRCNIANVSVNGELLGTYSHIEAINTSFLQRVFGNSNGELYEGQLVDFAPEWTARWSNKTPSTPKIANSLRQIANTLQNTTDENIVSELGKKVDIDKFITFWAMEIILQHEDGYAANRNNFYVYLNPANAKKVEFIPWGMNYIDKTKYDLRKYVGAEIPRRLSRIAIIRDSLTSRINTILDLHWNEATLHNYIDLIATKVNQCQTDNNHKNYVLELKEWVTKRKSTLKEELNNGIPVGRSERGNNCFLNETEN